MRAHRWHSLISHSPHLLTQVGVRLNKGGKPSDDSFKIEREKKSGAARKKNGPRLGWKKCFAVTQMEAIKLHLTNKRKNIRLCSWSFNHGPVGKQGDFDAEGCRFKSGIFIHYFPVLIGDLKMKWNYLGSRIYKSHAPLYFLFSLA